jgi:lysophospholipase
MTAAHPRRTHPHGLSFDQWRAADGWMLRRFTLANPERSRGSLLFLGGRGDFVEKYLEALAHWHGQGWSIAGFDWRGQGGSGRLLADPLVCHQSDFDVLLADLDRFTRQWMSETAAPHVIIAHSMGAHLVLRMLARDASGVAAAILESPMIAIRALGLPGWLLGLAARGACLLGRSERCVWRSDIGDVGGRMTSCPERREDKMWWKLQRPEIASGPPSWGWLRAAHVSVRRLPHSELERIATPILLLASEKDPVIDVGAVRRAAAMLPQAELDVVPGTGHELLREADARRLPVLARIDTFLESLTGSVATRTAEDA